MMASPAGFARGHFRVAEGSVTGLSRGRGGNQGSKCGVFTERFAAVPSLAWSHCVRLRAHLSRASGFTATADPRLSQTCCPALQSTLGSAYSSPVKELIEEEEEDGVGERLVVADSAVQHVLCLSNGHGEDTIAIAVLKELVALARERRHALVVEALPLVGVGSAYCQEGIEIVGPAKIMPSGGFVYMDILQLFGDMRAGLLSLTLDQWRAIVRWLDERPNSFIIAVGDIFPLAFAWLASRHARRKHSRALAYAFIGTAKSEFYLQRNTKRSSSHGKQFHVESFLGGVYLPWERAIMADSNCRLVAPRDGLTVDILKQRLPAAAQDKVHDLGNPMMDGLDPTGALDFLEKHQCGPIITILPGSRIPESHNNWRMLLEASGYVSALLYPKEVVYLTPVVPSLEPGPFYDALMDAGWVADWSNQDHLQSCHAGNVTTQKEHRERVNLWPENNGLLTLHFRKVNAVMLLLRGGFSDAAHWAEAAIAMAGTGTEQLVGLGKPVFTVPGGGPQFTYAFAEAQSRLLGKSVFLCENPESLAAKLTEVLSGKARASEFVMNGRERMGEPGSARRIAEQLLCSMHGGMSFSDCEAPSNP